MADLGFRGEVVDLYHRFRRGYPAAVIDTVVEEFGLTGEDTVIDVGCGTGQLTIPLARRVGAVLGMDPEPDMLARARTAGEEGQVRNALWSLAADTDMPTVGRLLGAQRVAAATVGQALHWMRPKELFAELVPMIRPGGGVAVISNGTPLWLQDSEWSRALRAFLEEWFNTTVRATCGTDPATRRVYAQELTAAGFAVSERSVEYTDDLELEELVGGLLSAFSVDQLPRADQRSAFAERVRSALPEQQHYTEEVRVTMLLGKLG